MPLPPGPRVLDARAELEAILDGSAAYLPVPDDPAQARHLAGLLDGEVDDDVCLVVTTSGTTGEPKGAMHTAASLSASAQATHERLGGPGNWLLPLVPHHIAGLQVLLRALCAGFTPVVLDTNAGFDLDALVRAVDAFEGPRRYTSLVPTALHKALGSPSATAALASLDAILVGGAATPPALANAASQAGLPIVRTYGMSETAGGCVYDGVALPGVTVDIAQPGTDGTGRVVLGGPMVARGYHGMPDHPAFVTAGRFRTDDLGRLDDDGVLSITGRADEAISTGGLTVIPQVVEAVILDDPAVAQCAVVGLPDERLGEKVTAFVVAAGNEPVDAERIRSAVAERLDRYAAPREVVVVDDLPTRGPGKIDRRALRDAHS